MGGFGIEQGPAADTVARQMEVAGAIVPGDREGTFEIAEATRLDHASPLGQRGDRSYVEDTGIIVGFEKRRVERTRSVVDHPSR